MFCLMPKHADAFLNALKSGEIDPAKLAKMSSEERNAFLGKHVGTENAKQVNSLFESKLLLKNQKAGMIRWAKTVGGLTEPARRDLIGRISRLDRVLNPAEGEQFLKDLASTRLGVDVTESEARTISKLSSKIQETSQANLSSKEDALKKGFQPSAADLAHGYARYDLTKYISDLKSGTTKFKASDLKTVKGIGSTIVHLPKAVADVSKSIGASLDDSFALRQGFKAFFTNNRQWQKAFIQSFRDIVKGAKDAEAAQRDIKAHLMADPVYDQAVKDGLAITKEEDVFPTSLPGKVPVLGRAFNASEVAYDGFAENLRLGIYKQQMRLAKDLGQDMGEKFGKNMAKEVNSLTGRGGFGAQEGIAEKANLAFYSLRFLKSNVDTLLLHPTGIGIGGVGSVAQKTAAKNLIKIIAGTAAILGTADALKPGSVDFDPRSSDFGKIKVGDTRFEVTGGMDGLVTLAARLAKQSTKSSTSGAVTKLNTGAYGGQTEFDTVLDFLSNKASPAGGVLVDKLKGTTPSGQKTTAKGEALKLVTPLNVNNFVELKNDPNSANILSAMISDTFGISTNTYGKSTTNWANNPSKTLQAFQQKVGASEFKNANDDYNKKLDGFMQKVTTNPTYKVLPDDQKTAVLSAAKAKIQAEVFKSYNFKPPKTVKVSGQAKKSLLQLTN